MIYFVRHGESQANVDRVYAGQRTNSPLTQRGIEQAHHAAKDILAKKLTFEHIICSPLRRSRDTALIIARDIDFDPAQIVTDPRITEYDMGSLTGTPMGITSAELIAPDDAEDVNEFQQRVVTAIHDYQGRPGNTLLVSHAGVSKVIEATKHHHKPHIFLDLDGYPHGQVTPVELP